MRSGKSFAKGFAAINRFNSKKDSKYKRRESGFDDKPDFDKGK